MSEPGYAARRQALGGRDLRIDIRRFGHLKDSALPGGLFPGRDPGQPVTTRQLDWACKAAAKTSLAAMT